MSFETEVPPPIPYTPLRRSPVDVHCLLTQSDDDVLLVRTGVWRRVVCLFVTATICCFCALFLIPLHSSLTIENYRVSREVMLFAWPAMAVAMGLIVLSVGVLFVSPIRFDRSKGSVGRGGWVPGWWERDLKDVLAIQVCRGKADVTIGERRDKIELTYQLNLVFADSLPTRRNVCQHRDRRWIERAARQIADFLGTPVLNYIGYTPGSSGTPGTLERTDAEARRLIAVRHPTSTKGPTLLCLTSVTALLLTCCGCPPRPPSQEEQRAGTPSRWITVEPTNDGAGGKLSVKDAEAIIAQIPVVSELVVERVHSATIRSENSQSAVEISATGPSYLRFLKETTRADVKAGRFLEAADCEGVASVIILDEKLAEKLFAETDSIGRSVTIGQQTLTVIGVVTQPHSVRSGDVTRDAYLPRESFRHQPSAATEESPESLDRIRVRVDRLDQVEDAKVVMRSIIDKLHRDEMFVVQ